mmetsp:Transcript_1052/g.1811  ORF Transcript_1052/g.1811 Transcript_1052/m.1811 type:complete len:214 (+) Transcript_1052:271-912(+)
MFVSSSMSSPIHSAERGRISQGPSPKNQADHCTDPHSVRLLYQRDAFRTEYYLGTEHAESSGLHSQRTQRDFRARSRRKKRDLCTLWRPHQPPQHRPTSQSAILLQRDGQVAADLCGHRLPTGRRGQDSVWSAQQPSAAHDVRVRSARQLIRVCRAQCTAGSARSSLGLEARPAQTHRETLSKRDRDTPLSFREARRCVCAGDEGKAHHIGRD